MTALLVSAHKHNMMIELMTSPRLLHQSENVLQQTTLSMKREGEIKITHFTLYKYQRNSMWVNHKYIYIYTCQSQNFRP